MHFRVRHKKECGWGRRRSPLAGEVCGGPGEPRTLGNKISDAFER
ncbi:hypothetical protein E2C01_092987 [Portunus trituberculatus]|uniref:Uncharacterized protein n=1 Tax=Portunus trituberculatus TaxID=210409 RepID=A0A5B7JTC1_PORTR|nr:hypothetical protein [Portunus trituberculatus]